MSHRTLSRELPALQLEGQLCSVLGGCTILPEEKDCSLGSSWSPLAGHRHQNKLGRGDKGHTEQQPQCLQCGENDEEFQASEHIQCLLFRDSPQLVLLLVQSTETIPGQCRILAWTF